MLRPTKKALPNGSEIIEVFYGINMDSCDVESVTVCRDGTLTKRNRDKSLAVHGLRPGVDPEKEIRLFYNLSNLLIFSAEPGLDSHPAVLRLERKAEELRCARDADPRHSSMRRTA